MRKIFQVGVAVACASTASIAQAQAASACLTNDEARALFTFVMPEAVEGMAQTCHDALPSTAFLTTRSDEMVGRFRAAATGSWPQAKAAFLKISDDGPEENVMAAMPDAALQPFVAAAFKQVVANDVKPADCPKVDRFVAALAPLPPSNVAELITALMALVGGNEREFLRIC